MKEDCLILNVFVPLLIDFSGEVTGQLDVMFYVHGGSFLHGRSTSTTHDGRWLANESENIIVTINYRLGKQNITNLQTIYYSHVNVFKMCCACIFL